MAQYVATRPVRHEERVGVLVRLGLPLQIASARSLVVVFFDVLPESRLRLVLITVQVAGSLSLQRFLHAGGF